MSIAGVIRFGQWFDETFVGGKIEAEAATHLIEARQLLEAGNATAARELLQPIIERVDNPDIVPDALVLQATIEVEAGDSEAALLLLATAMERYPDIPEYAEISLRYARLLEDTGQYEEAVAVYTDIRAVAPPQFRIPAITGLGRHNERQGKTELARDLYRLALQDATWGSEAWFEAASGAGRLNVAAIFGPAPTPDSKVYTVERGDTLTRIGMKLNTTQGLLARANNLKNPNDLRINQSLKYTPKDFNIVIESSTCRLYLVDSEGVFKVYQVGLGKPGQETAPGRYRIGNKEKDPTWHKPGFGPIPPGDPRNELGTRWMPLLGEEPGLPTDLGIHGTIAPETVGKYSSMGCPRLFADEVEELYDLVVRSTPVTIVEKYDPNVAL